MGTGSLARTISAQERKRRAAANALAQTLDDETASATAELDSVLAEMVAVRADLQDDTLREQQLSLADITEVEIFLNIFRFLSTKELGRLACVSRDFGGPPAAGGLVEEASRLWVLARRPELEDSMGGWTKSCLAQRHDLILDATKAMVNRIVIRPSFYDRTSVDQADTSEEVARLLRDEDADPNLSTDAYGTTALAWAARYNNVPTMKVLVEAGADLEKANDSGHTALMIAIQYDSKHAVQWLLEHVARSGDYERRYTAEQVPRLEVIGSFDAMGLSELLLRGIYAYGFAKPSVVQHRAIKPLMSGQDTIAQAQSGTGKTTAFCIGVLQTVDIEDRHTQALILAPTRELAQMIQKVIIALGDYLKCQCVGTTRTLGAPTCLLAHIQRACLRVRWWV